MSSRRIVHVFVGPTLPKDQVLEIVPGACLHPPIAHGDLTDHCRAGDVAVLIDGFFHQVAAVRHKEIISAIRRGVTVAGAASMGALRAAELNAFGMIGHGEVYRMYASGLVDGDDEVAVVHGGLDDDWRQLTVPVVNVRSVIAELIRTHRLKPEPAAAVITARKQMHDRRRTLTGLEKELQKAGCAEDMVAMIHNELKASDAKRQDAVGLLKSIAAGELSASSQPTETCGEYCDRSCGLQETHFQALWRWRGEKYGATNVASLTEALQVFAPEFPAALSSAAFAVIAGKANGEATAADAIEAALKYGYLHEGWEAQNVAPPALTGFLANTDLLRWATAGGHERTQLVTRALVRSCRVAPGVPPLRLALHQLPESVKRAAAETCLRADEHNEAQAAIDSRRMPHRVKPHLTTALLTRAWGAPADEYGALDRGFVSLGAAMRATQRFVPVAIADEIVVPWSAANQSANR